ncbi:MAG TPA: glycoside hydrolase family 38 C-terminal domain-containing protein [Ktedonobacteraceae bacterium]|nr:glycoside hydrolase family 38 C-terminal domain-containing protein [Ktedonobacteraceae bacterium]
MSEQLNIILVPHTHWDREWYQTFQQFRIRLVRTVDKLLDILDQDDQFTHFMLDGQTIVLDDYLEIQPEQEQRLRHYIESGRILVGPWYIQPDEFLVSGEALIRNLQIGLQQASQFGNPMRVGYVPDCFGHIAQLPQILQGCGIDSAVFWRGVGEEARQSEFNWQAPDGSQVLVIFLADPIGYSNARQMPLNPREFVMRTELLASNLLPKATTNTLLFMNGSDHLEAQAGLPATIEAANQLLSDLDPSHEEFLMRSMPKQQNGSTKRYEAIHVQIGTLPQYIECVRNQNMQLDTLHGEMRSSQHAHLLPAVLSTRMWIKQQNTLTEQLLERWVEPLATWASLLGYTYPKGLIRMAWRYLLQNHPHDSICGCSIDQVHRENSVRFAQSQQIGENVVAQAMQQIAAEVDTRAPITAAHPGDQPIPLVVFNPAPGPRNAEAQTTVQLPGSLYNAAIVDERGEALPYRIANRWRQEIGSMPVAREILAASVALADVKTGKDFVQMAHNMIKTALAQADDIHVISHVYIENYTDSPIHHIHHVPQPGVIYIEVMIAPRGRIMVNEQEIEAAGEHILKLLEQDEIHTFEVTLVDQARETIDFIAAQLPAYGLKTFWLYPHGLKDGAQSFQNALEAQESRIENEFYRVEVNAQDGTLTVTDKQNGMVFAGLNRFVDGGDVGDLYTYCPPERDILIGTPMEPPRIELANPGPVRATLRISSRWALPGACAANRAERSARLTTCLIVSEVSLLPGVRRIDIHTSIENKARDHRLRVLFPVPYSAEQVAAEGTFEVRTRPVSQARPLNIAEWAEEPVDVFPQKRFVDLSNGEVGLGILNRGLPECEIVRDGLGLEQTGAQATIALTLLRCVDWLSRGDLTTRHGHAGPMEQTPEAQCLGRQEFDYALVPHSGNWQAEEALVLREAQAFNAPITTHVVVAEQHEGPLAPCSTLVEVEPRELVVSAIKRRNHGSGLVVRIYNPLDREIDAIISPGVAFATVHMANLLEEYQEQMETSSALKPRDARSVQVRICGGRIVTLVFE